MTSDPATIDLLAQQLAEFEIELSDDQVAMLDRYRQALWTVNESINLTRHTTYEKFVARDLVDSMALEPWLEQGEQVLDLGTGGGVPGVILAILRDDLAISLCDSVGKKARAVESIVEQLGLPVAVAHSRAEELLALTPYDTVVVRAVAPLKKLLTWLRPHWEHCDRLLIIKGKNWMAERGEARHLGLMQGIELRVQSTYQTPGTDAESVVLSLEQRRRR